MLHVAPTPAEPTPTSSPNSFPHTHLRPSSLGSTAGWDERSATWGRYSFVQSTTYRQPQPTYLDVCQMPKKNLHKPTYRNTTFMLFMIIKKRPLANDFSSRANPHLLCQQRSAQSVYSTVCIDFSSLIQGKESTERSLFFFTISILCSDPWSHVRGGHTK